MASPLSDQTENSHSHHNSADNVYRHELYHAREEESWICQGKCHLWRSVFSTYPGVNESKEKD